MCAVDKNDNTHKENVNDFWGFNRNTKHKYIYFDILCPFIQHLARCDSPVLTKITLCLLWVSAPGGGEGTLWIFTKPSA